MASLLDLPNELLLQIIGKTIPDDIESFSECCTDMKVLAEEMLAQHKSDHYSYSAVKITDCSDIASEAINPRDLLEDILRTPRLALYPTHVFIGESWDRFMVQSSNIEGTEEDFDDELKDLIRKALEDCPYVYPNEVDERASDIRRGGMDATMAMLLALLPNVQSIKLFDKWFIGDYCWDMLDRITKASHEKYLPQDALSKLTKVGVHTHLITETPEEAQFLQHFAGLPSVQELRSDLNCTSTTMPLSWPCYQGGVTSIVITNSTLHPQLLFPLLERTSALQNFTYSRCVVDNTEWFPFEVCQALREHTSTSLEHLNLNWDAAVENRGSHDHLGDLRRFVSLKTLSVNLAMLNYQVNLGTRKYKQLADFLPASIEELELVGGGRDWDDGDNSISSWSISLQQDDQNDALGNRTPKEITSLFDGLAEAKGKHLPNLKRITFQWFYKSDHQYAATYQQIREVCEKAGCALEGPEPYVPDPWELE